ncbi:MAG TPA: carboxypeptidase-like regulatory domain-containing protein, partial [Vicinamibacterales bacterium]|nr:carboxypeptidase-like regulatory domain-containing protein [Vicinamibacterales bacterium]
MKISSWCSALVISSIALLLGVSPLPAQTHFASFTGTVFSSDGNPVPDVEVVATNVATQVTYTARSNAEGLYTVSALPIGAYKLTAQASGFQAYETNEIKLESGQNARVDVTLQVGGFGEKVEVTGVTPILQTQDAVVGEVLSETTISNMPLNGRNFSQLSLLLPGAISTDPNSFTNPKNFGSGRPNVNGQREQSNN